jgi:hypothetical protein
VQLSALTSQVLHLDPHLSHCSLDLSNKPNSSEGANYLYSPARHLSTHLLLHGEKIDLPCKESLPVWQSEQDDALSLHILHSGLHL